MKTEIIGKAIAFQVIYGFITYCLITGVPASAHGGENIIKGNPWHHYDMSRRAAAGDRCFLDPEQYPGPIRVPGRCVSQTGIEEIEIQSALGGESEASGIPQELYAGAGFSRDAAITLGWHTDWVDSYLYNPTWWAKDLGSRRLIASLASAEELKKVHFDDLFSTQAINESWTRYSAGTVIALDWAAERWALAKGRLQSQSLTAHERSMFETEMLDAQQAAFNALGASLHAIQDFYSHTTWINNPDLRQTTWLELSPSERSSVSIVSGAFETPLSGQPLHHGDYAISCSILKKTKLQRIIEPACSAFSPLDKSNLCGQVHRCENAERLSPEFFSLGGDSGLVYIEPVGINLDNLSLAGFGGKKRNILDSEGRFETGEIQNMINVANCATIINHVIDTESDEQSKDWATCHNDDELVPSRLLFATAKNLAIEASTQWLHILEEQMRSTGNSAFWTALKTYRHDEDIEQSLREAQFENFAAFPYQFITAGPYPVTRPGESAGYYLRVDIETSDISRSGNDSDISLTANDQTYLLDYLSTRYDPETGEVRASTVERIVSYNDFERGNRTVYTVGPFSSLPTNITLHNGDANARDVLRGLGLEFRDAFRRAGARFKDVAIAIVGAGADYVDTQTRYWTRDELDRIIASGGVAKIKFERGDEGEFDYDIRVRRTSWRGSARQATWAEYEISLVGFLCVRESRRDGVGSNSDEPFSVWALRSLLTDNPDSYATDIFDDVDAGERFSIGHSFRPVRLPSDGAIVLAGQHMESDRPREAAAYRERDQLLEEFVTGVEREVAPRQGRFLSALGRTVAPDWHVANINVYAFKRTARPEAGRVYSASLNRWVEGGESLTLRLEGGLRPLRAAPATAQYTGEPVFVSTPISRAFTGVKPQVGQKPLIRDPRLKIPGARRPSVIRDSGPTIPTTPDITLPNGSSNREASEINQGSRLPDTPLYSWYSASRGDNFATSDPRWSANKALEISGSSSLKKDGYRLYRIEGMLFDPKGKQPKETIPLYSWWNPQCKDNFTTSNPHWSMPVSDIQWKQQAIENGRSKEGYTLYRLEGFLYDPQKPQPAGTKAVFSWYHPGRGDNFLTSDPSWSMPVDEIEWIGEHIKNGPARDGYTLYRLEGFVHPKP